jgi:hypothetical protein
VYLVQSSSTWFPFPACTTNNKINDTLYGNEENFYSGVPNSNPLQCVYMIGSPEEPERFKPGGLPGDLVFTDGDPSNDFIGPGGELPVLIGGQGGGGGGSRVDSLQHGIWGLGPFGLPQPSPPAPPFYPNIFINNTYYSPALFDGKGGGGGGGGGAVQIRSFTDITIGRTGHIDASGGHGGGGEVVQNTNVGAGGGGGSGGAILLQAAEDILIQADADHASANFTDTNGLEGAALDVSGGYGRDAQTLTPDMDYTLKVFTWDSTRADGGQGGFGLIQLQSGNGSAPTVEEGAFLFARQRSTVKRGTWTGDSAAYEREHPDYNPYDPLNPTIYDELRYVDMLHYRQYRVASILNRYYVLNGANPPIIPSVDGDDGQGLINEFPVGSGKFWADTKMTRTALSQDQWVVQDANPSQIMKVYDGWNPNTYTEEHANGEPPGETWTATDEIPLSISLNEPDGTAKSIDVDGVSVFDPAETVDRLPVVSPDITPPPFGTVSVGVSRWLDFHGVSLRTRSAQGRTPPFFAPVNGTYNAAAGVVPPGKDGQVILAGDVPTKPMKYVANAGFAPVDPGLFGNGVGNGDPPDPPFNDLKIDSPEFGQDNALTNNATVVLQYQGAYAIRPGSGVPDVTTLTEWVSDVTELNGMPLVRFRVSFDVGADVGAFPFGLDSYRPQSDYIRLRATY